MDGATRLGRYEIVRPIARGGMAEVFLARAHGPGGFEKQVALKRIHPALAEDPSFAAMFLDEARVAARLEHANVVQVFDVGSGGGALFLAMEYVDGADVRALCARGAPLPLDQAVAIAIGAAAGLHHAHQLGLVHRDVSPANILCSRAGAVKLADFGIAKAHDNRNVTRVGMTMGKAGYMAPEQCVGGAVDRRADVFALGVVLYEMTVGRSPFTERNQQALATLIATVDAPAPSTWAAGYPPDLERIVRKAMARDPDRRYESAEAFGVELETFAARARLDVSPRGVAALVAARLAGGERDAAGDPMSAGFATRLVTAAAVSPAASRPRKRRVGVASAVVVAATAVAGLAVWWTTRTEREPAEVVTPTPAPVTAAEPAQPRPARKTAPLAPAEPATAAPSQPRTERGRPRARTRRPDTRPSPARPAPAPAPEPATPRPPADDDPDSPFPGEWRPP